MYICVFNALFFFSLSIFLYWISRYHERTALYYNRICDHRHIRIVRHSNVVRRSTATEDGPPSRSLGGFEIHRRFRTKVQRFPISITSIILYPFSYTSPRFRRVFFFLLLLYLFFVVFVTRYFIWLHIFSVLPSPAQIQLPVVLLLSYVALVRFVRCASPVLLDLHLVLSALV